MAQGMVKLWTVDVESKKATEMAWTNRVNDEALLEDILVKNPDMLSPGLEIVGRQMPTDSGSLDLLGVDSDGRLVVFELKRGKPTRDAVAQVLDYASCINAMDDDKVSEFIESGSSRNGSDPIESFREWYGERFDEQQSSYSSSVRMVLVGLGVDEKTKRMVDYLAGSGVDIELLTFHGYERDGGTILARQVQVDEDRRRTTSRSTATRCEEMFQRAEERGIGREFLSDVMDDLKHPGNHPVFFSRGNGCTFYYDWFRMEEKGYLTPYSIRLNHNGKVRIVFFPIAVHLAKEEFDQTSRSLEFNRKQSRISMVTSDVKEKWEVVLTAESWDRHKAQIRDLACAVRDAWCGVPSDREGD